MKKIILSLAMAMTVIGASAQNTYNVRVGGGILNEGNDTFTTFTAMAQANISLNNLGYWVFSPAVQLSTGEDNTTIMLHANMGYRKRIGNNCLFVPKVGVAGGYLSEAGNYEKIPVGPSIDLGLELKRFVIGLTGFYSLNQPCHGDNIIMLSLTLGYTF